MYFQPHHNRELVFLKQNTSSMSIDSDRIGGVENLSEKLQNGNVCCHLPEKVEFHRVGTDPNCFLIPVILLNKPSKTIAVEF